jgi:hypothetical protein
VQLPSLDAFWICESFLYFIEKLDFDARIKLMDSEKNAKNRL